MKKLLKKILFKLGYNLSKIPKNVPPNDSFSKIKLKYHTEIRDIEALSQIALTIPGMISASAGQLLYTLCYMQEEIGDVVEIGSWQGRSTSFLGRAVNDSKNGRFFAIDHFLGNKGKEKLYVVNKADLSDLKKEFLLNMDKHGIKDVVNLIDMPNDLAINELEGSKIRFLFIDGDHSEEGVEKDISLFFPKLVDGAIVVFDDYSPDFPGLIKSIDRLLLKIDVKKIFVNNRTLVIKL